MAESCQKLPLIDDEILAECIASAIHKDSTEQKAIITKQEREANNLLNDFSRESFQGLNRELCSLIEFVLKYDFENKLAKERTSSWCKNFPETEKKETESLHAKAVSPKNPEQISARGKVEKNLLGDEKPSSSKSHFSLDSNFRSELLGVYKPSLKDPHKSLRMMPYPVPLCKNSWHFGKDGISSGRRRKFKVRRNWQSLCSVSDHQESTPTSIYVLNNERTNTSEADTCGRRCKDHIQELIFKIYSEQQTLEELLRCKTQGRYKPCNPARHSSDVLDQPLLNTPSPPRFLQRCVLNAEAKPDMCLESSDLCKVPQGDDCKEESFDARQVPYFEEKRGVAKQLDELLSMKWCNRIRFV